MCQFQRFATHTQTDLKTVVEFEIDTYRYNNIFFL